MFRPIMCAEDASQQRWPVHVSLHVRCLFMRNNHEMNGCFYETTMELRQTAQDTSKTTQFYAIENL